MLIYIITVSFAPRHKPLPFCTTLMPSFVVANLTKLGADDKTFVGFLESIDLAAPLDISNALTGF